MPLHTRASMISLSASEKRSKLLVGQGAGLHLLLVAVNETLSVPKKSCRACTKAPLMQVCPDGWSGKPGVTSGGPETGMDGSKSGSQAGSASVAGLPSLAASRSAVIGRQKLQWYLSFQQPIEPSAPARFVIASRRALSTPSSCSLSARARKTRFQIAMPLSCQKIAAAVWSAVRLVLVSEPSFLTS